MENLKFTKGEWKQKGLSVRYNNKIIANIDPLNGDYSIENEANAKLIAAAPDMLEALIEVEEWASRFGLGQEQYKKVINAINKATK